MAEMFSGVIARMKCTVRSISRFWLRNERLMDRPDGNGNLIFRKRNHGTRRGNRSVISRIAIPPAPPTISCWWSKVNVKHCRTIRNVQLSPLNFWPTSHHLFVESIAVIHMGFVPVDYRFLQSWCYSDRYYFDANQLNRQLSWCNALPQR